MIALLIIAITILLFSGKLVKLLEQNSRRNRLTGLLWPVLVSLLALFMVSHPGEVFQASLAGLETWWQIVFPALLPFFIISELFLGLGVVQFLGALLEPIMRPVFNVPGVGSFVLAIGYTSGFPIGSIITSRLHRDGLCSKAEAERLVSFTNNASPLFMFGAVAVGMYHRPDLGFIIAGSHYLANIILGLILRFYGKGEPLPPARAALAGGLLRKAIRSMVQAQAADGRPLGKLLGDSIRTSVSNLLNIGGFIILFSVLIRVMTITGIQDILVNGFRVFLEPLGFNSSVVQALAAGFWEITLGTKLASEANAPLWQQLVITSAILGWSGLAIQAQVASIIAENRLNMAVFVVARIGHSLLAAMLTFLFFGPLRPAADFLIRPVFSPSGPPPIEPAAYYRYALLQLVLLFAVAIIVTLLIRIACSLKLAFKHRLLR